MQNDHLSNSFAIARATTLGGILSSVAIGVLFFYQPADRAAEQRMQNPVASRVLAEARILMREKKWTVAAERLREYATAENPLVLLHYARILAGGWGVPSNPSLAREKLLVAVQQNFPQRAEAAYELAKLYRKSAEIDCYRLAFEWFHKAAKWGATKAHAELGRHYSKGIGTPVNMRNALKHYRLAAKAGSATTLVKFARLLSKRKEKTGFSEIDPEDVIAESIIFLQRDAHLKKPSAAKALGRIYRNGVFVQEDRNKALYWFRRAALLGDTGAMHELGVLLLANKPNKKNVAEGLSILRRAAGHGDAGALTALGRLHLKERFGLPQKEAPAFFAKAIRFGHAGAMEEMARLYLTGTLTEQNIDEAYELATRGSSLGHRGSRSLLQKIMRLRKLEKQSSLGMTRATGGRSFTSRKRGLI